MGLFNPVIIASLFGRSSGCSPDSAPPSGAAHAGSVVNPDPPCLSPPRHVSVRHITVFTKLISVLILRASPQRILLAFYFSPLHFLVLAPPGPQLWALFPRLPDPAVSHQSSPLSPVSFSPFTSSSLSPVLFSSFSASCPSCLSFLSSSSESAHLFLFPSFLSWVRRGLRV